MKIKLIVAVPVEGKHGLTMGRIMEATLENRKLSYRSHGERPYYWVVGDTGEKVGVLQHEAVIVKEDE